MPTVYRPATLPHTGLKTYVQNFWSYARFNLGFGFESGNGAHAQG